MATTYGAIVPADFADVRVAQIGQQFIYDKTVLGLRDFNNALELAMSVFVDGRTSAYDEQYRLSVGGRLQRRGANARVGATKSPLSWGVQYPLEDFGGRVSANDVDFAYMTGAAYNTHVEGVMEAAKNTLRFEILRALFNNTARTFIDRTRNDATLTVQPLANGDTVTYPPVEGSETAAVENHYLETGYAASSISDSNNPYQALIVPDLQEHFGSQTGGSNIVTFINSAQQIKTEDLSDFDAVDDAYVRRGDNADIPFNMPTIPGQIIGRTNGTWVSVWSWVPANYMVAIHLEAPAPLKMRVDPPDVGLGNGDLELVVLDPTYPFRDAEWRQRYGIGVGNRLNGVVVELGTGGTYSIPSAYA